MSGFGYSLNITSNTLAVSREVAAIRDGLEPRQLLPIAGRAARNAYRAHLFARNSSNPNALAGRRTNYWAGAARATSFQIVGDSTVVISIAQVGIGLQLRGGVVRPVTAKYLTIPACPEAHGKRAREFPALVLVYGAHGQPIALAYPLFTRTLRQIGDVTGRRRLGTTRTGGRHGGIVFWLAKQVTIQPDPTVLPAPYEVERAAVAALDDYAQRLWDRKNPPPAGSENGGAS